MSNYLPDYELLESSDDSSNNNQHDLVLDDIMIAFAVEQHDLIEQSDLVDVQVRFRDRLSDEARRNRQRRIPLAPCWILICLLGGACMNQGMMIR